MDMRTLIGVDGCKAGWLAVRHDPSGSLTATCYSDADALFHSAGDALVAIDIPIGLPSDQPRTCDLAARAFLGPARARSVFPTPPRACLAHQHDYEAACGASAKAYGKKISKQSFAILPKIAQVDRCLLSDARQAARTWEVHPELCFAILNGGKAAQHRKASGFGFAERFHLLGARFPGAAERIRAQFDPAAVADDDILDALVALWTAERIAHGTARAFGDPSERDACGLKMLIWA